MTSAVIGEYLASLPAERGIMMRALRDIILRNLPAGYSERLVGGMINYEVPLDRFPKTYNGQPLLLAALASQKSYVTLYLMAVYGDQSLRSWFDAAYARSGKKLNMGRSCVHFRRLDDIPYDVIGGAIAKVPVQKYIEIYEAARQPSVRQEATRKSG